MKDETLPTEIPVHYDPNYFVNQLAKRLHARNDAALCRRLDIRAPLISKIRHKKLPISAPLLIRAHEETGLEIAELRQMMGDRRHHYRVSALYTPPTPGMIPGRADTARAQDNAVS